MTPILDPSKHWECPSCHAQHVTHEPLPHMPMHPCSAQRGLTVPYVEVLGSELLRNAVRHVVVEREDYVAQETVTTDSEGLPVMAVRTERADGSNDCHVFAGVAQVSARSEEHFDGMG